LCCFGGKNYLVGQESGIRIELSQGGQRGFLLAHGIDGLDAAGAILIKDQGYPNTRRTSTVRSLAMMDLLELLN
jgi:hypothetical protein